MKAKANVVVISEQIKDNDIEGDTARSFSQRIFMEETHTKYKDTIP